jgi:predicted Zn-ribbon and HTH transcriptional regulator
MNFDEFKEFNKTIAALYNKSFSDIGELDILYDLYKPYSFQEMREVLKEYTKNKTFCPKPAELLKIAEANRHQREILQAAEETKQIRYDSEGRRIYKCPYCKDSGYMIVDDDEIYSPSATRCICQNPIKKLELEQNGRVRLRLKSAHRRSDNYYVFDFAKAMFIPEDKKHQNTPLRAADRRQPEKVLQQAIEEMKLPF